MQDEDKTIEQLITELHELRKRLPESQKGKAESKQTERALWESQQMLHLVLDTIPVRVFWKDLDSNYLGCNRPFALDAGLQSPEEILGKNDFEMGWAEHAELYRSDDRLVMQTGSPKLGYEEPLTAPDGSKIWLRTNKVPLLDSEGRIKGVLGTYEDITKSKRLEEMLRESETKYRIVADNTYDWEYWASPEGRFLYTSPSCQRITGYAADEFVADPKLLFRIVHPDDLIQFETHIERDETTISPCSMGFRIIHRDGTTKWIGHICQPVFDPQGRFLGRRGSNRDITDRKQVEESLRESESFLRATGRMAKVGGWEVNAETLEVHWTEETYHIHEVPVGHKPPLEEAIDFFHPDDREKLMTAIRRALDQGEPYEMELRLITAKGKQLWTRTTCKPQIVDGKTVKLSGTFQDITERKRMEEAIRESAEKIKLFAYTVCHDLKSPSIALYGLTKRLQRLYSDVLDEKGRHYCDQILKASEQIASLVESINQFIVTKESPLTIENVKLQEILAVVRDEFSAQLTLRQITWAIPENMTEFKADQLSMLRVVRNLVENALKYGGDELSEIRIGYEESDDHHVISVTNDGASIEYEDAERIFMPFNRARGVLEVRGAGLGLAIVKEIAEHHGGMAWFKPIGREKGCAFYVSISKEL